MRKLGKTFYKFLTLIQTTVLHSRLRLLRKVLSAVSAAALMKTFVYNITVYFISWNHFFDTLSATLLKTRTSAQLSTFGRVVVYHSLD